MQTAQANALGDGVRDSRWGRLCTRGRPAGGAHQVRTRQQLDQTAAAWAAAAALVVVGLVQGLNPPLVLAQTVQHAGRSVTTQPALAPDEAARRFVVPAGFEMRLFAAEPDVVNPVAMSFDPRGRLWVLELYEYPRGAAKGQPGRDRILILEDTDGDGRADRRTVWYEGLNLACGLAYGAYRGQAGVYVGQAPYLLHIPQQADGSAGEPRIVRGGFGLHDTHELVNGFQWGPDGRLYMTHGVFTRSYVRDPHNPADTGVKIDAAVARFDPRADRFEIFADGMSNQWGVDFDASGQAFVSACVIDHLFHVAPGGVYVRQAGTPGFAYAYQMLRSIVGHKHQKAAYCGVAVIATPHWPAAYQQSLIMGNIHGHAINRDSATPRGSSYWATDAGDLLTANDGWFMPVSLQFGPDGQLWIADWYDRYPCYQNAQADPAGVDRTHGRIWRLVYVGDQAGRAIPPVPAGLGDLAARPSGDLVKLLADANPWHRRTASRLLIERSDAADVAAMIRHVADDGGPPAARRTAVWTWYAINLPDRRRASAEAFAADDDPAIRAWVARVLGERGDLTDDESRCLTRLAGDRDPAVRREAAWATCRLSRTGAAGVDVPGVLHSLLSRSPTADDAMLRFYLWLAIEPTVAGNARPLLVSLVPPPTPAPGSVFHPGHPNHAVLADMMGRTARRLADTGQAERLDEILDYLGVLPLGQTSLAQAALSGLVEATKTQRQKPSAHATAALARWVVGPTPEIAALARRLAATWGDAAAAQALLTLVTDTAAPWSERLAGIEAARQLRGAAAAKALAEALAQPTTWARPTASGDTRPSRWLGELIAAAGQVGVESLADIVLAHWADLPANLRASAIETLATRPVWASAVLEAVAAERLTRADIPLPALRLLHDHPGLADRVTALLGRYKPDTGAYAKLIADKKAIVLSGPVDFQLGREMAAKHCLTCHKLHGRGAEVGPDITGVGRSHLEALLANVLNPNEVIGKGYENVLVRTSDERTLAGRLIEDAPTHVKLLAAGPKEEIVPRDEIDTLKVTDVSVMPEGLDKQMTDHEFRSLIWYVLAPPEDTDKPLRLVPGDKRLAVMFTPPSATAPVELLAYVMDPRLRPYLHPLRDPSGTVPLTEDRPADHPWQHGVFTGLHKVGPNGVDFWSEKAGQQRFVALTDVHHAADRVSWRSRTDWNAPNGTPLLIEEQTLTVTVPDPAARRYAVDIDWTLRLPDAALAAASPKPLTVGRYDYGGLAVRLVYHPVHDHLNSAGMRGKATANQTAAWCCVTRAFDSAGPSGTFTVAVLDHPANPGHPPRWRVDQQGLINPSPSLSGDWQIPPTPGGLTRRYRLVVEAGPPNAESLAAQFANLAGG